LCWFSFTVFTQRTGYHHGNQILTENLLAISQLVRTDALKEVGMFNSSIVHGMEDWDLWLKMAQRGMWGYTLPEFLFWYHRKPPGR
jgi:GT2 family glycosyltransferase